MGDFEPMNLIGILIQSIFIENFLLSIFLGMCTYLACSDRLKTANGLGIAVVFVVCMSGMINWCIHRFITGEEALFWMRKFGINVNLNFLEFLLFISVIAAFVQVLEIVIEKFSPALYNTLGIYLPLITVNCAILGISLFAVNKNYPFIPNAIYVTGSGLGWWLAIAIIAAIREKLSYSNIVPGLRGIGITFVMTGLISMIFMGFSGIKLAEPTGKNSQSEISEEIRE